MVQKPLQVNYESTLDFYLLYDIKQAQQSMRLTPSAHEATGFETRIANGLRTQLFSDHGLEVVGARSRGDPVETGFQSVKNHFRMSLQSWSQLHCRVLSHIFSGATALILFNYFGSQHVRPGIKRKIRRRAV